jgi:pimeloyl-ACP methyl ester carboxylesterase
MGSAMTPEALDWWVRLMSATAASTLEGFLQMVPTVDVRGDLAAIRAPTQVITTTGSGLGSVDAVQAWQEMIPGSRLIVLPGDSYHVAASDPDAAARAVRDFVEAL